MAPTTIAAAQVAQPGNRRLRARRVLAALIALLLGAATFVLLALSGTKERSEARDQTVSDTLLARESIGFQVRREAEALQKIAADIGSGALGNEATEARLRLFLRRAGQVEGLLLVDGDLKPAARAHREGTRVDILAQLPEDVAGATVAKARESGRAAFSGEFLTDWGPSFALVVPVPDGAPARRFLIAVYSLDRLLVEMIPWNLAQDYEFTLADIAGTVRARRAAVGPGRNVYTHQEPLELGDTTLVLGANSVRGAPDWIADALRLGIAALGLLLLWSLVALWRDHARRMAAEKRVLEEAAFRRAMGDCAVIGLSARDLHGRMTYANPSFCEMTGYGVAKLLGQPSPLHLGHNDSDPASRSACEMQLERHDGTRIPVAVYDAPLLDAEGTQIGWTSSIVDLSEQKAAVERERMQQERLQTAARLTTMGEMASSLAHELNQPLNAVTSYLTGSLNMLNGDGVERSELVGALTKANAQAQRAGQVIRRVHEFVRKQEPRRETVDVAAMLADCEPLVALQARRAGVHVEAAIDPDLPSVSGDAVMLQQVVLNLTRNGIDAMVYTPPERRRLVVTATRNAAGVRLTVRDFGSGIPDEESERIFAPFFTTKAEGMGMGLSICRTVTQAHGGRLWFERMPDGTAFHLWLPCPR